MPRKSTKAMRELRAFLSGMAQQMQAISSAKRHGFAFASIAEFLLAHGREFIPARLPLWCPRMPLGRCFHNAYLLAQEYGLTYCEGYALSGQSVPYHHGWCVEPGSSLVIDPTWDQSLAGQGVAYFGAPFAWRYRRRFNHQRKGHGNTCLLDRWEEGWPILQEGHTGWAYNEEQAMRRWRRLRSRHVCASKAS